jgi:PAS domain S-box-containing protein
MVLSTGMSPVDPVRSAAEGFGNRLEFEILVSDLSARFINQPPGEVDRGIEDALRRVSQLLGIDLAVLWQASDATPAVFVPTHVYCARKDARLPGPMRQEQYPWSREQVLAGRAFTMASPDDLPPEAAVDRETCRMLGIKSALCVPLAAGGEQPVGALGFNALREHRDWPDALVRRLQLVAQIFANALARSRNESRLKESEARLSLAAESAEAGLWTLDYRTGVFWTTGRARTIFGAAPSEVLSAERLVASVHPDDRDLVRDVIDPCRGSNGPFHVEYRIALPGGEGARWVASRGRPHFGAAGEPEHLTGISIDITARRLADEALRKSEARLATAAELAHLGFYELDLGDGVSFVDERSREICGLPPTLERASQVIEFWMAHLHPDDRQRILALRERLHDGQVDQISVEYRYLHPTRGLRWLHDLARVARRDPVGHAVATLGVLRDVTESRQTEEELRDLGRRLIRAHEEERALLARELHDDLTQRLAVLAIEVGRVERDAPEAQAVAMRSVREALGRISEDVHSLAYQLHPSVLEELGLVEALRTECERVSHRLSGRLSMDIAPQPVGIGKAAALCLFRVAQEALGNVVRHAGACGASVSLRPARDGLRLVVRDDGVGFDPAKPARRSLGLASMRERVQLQGGTLEIESAPGRGTSVVAQVPLEEGAQ